MNAPLLHFDQLRASGGLAFDAHYDSGLQVLLGGPRDGAARLFAIAAGAESVSHGQVILEGESTYGNPAARRRLGVVLEREVLPSRRAAAETIAAVCAAWSVAPLVVRERLCRWGWESLMAAPPTQWAPELARAVTLAVALSRRDAGALLLWEPFDLVGDSQEELLAALRQFAETRPVIVGTAKWGIAEQLGGAGHVLEGGRILLSVPDFASAQLGSSATLLVRCERPAEVAAALADNENFLELRGANNPSQAFVVTARDGAAAAQELVRVTLELGVRLSLLERLPRSLEALQKALLGYRGEAPSGPSWALGSLAATSVTHSTEAPDVSTDGSVEAQDGSGSQASSLAEPIDPYSGTVSLAELKSEKEAPHE